MSTSQVLTGLCFLSAVVSILAADLGKVPCLRPLRMAYLSEGSYETLI